jgi:hypothetical protein
MYRLYGIDDAAERSGTPPRWIDTGVSEEQLLTEKGWGFLSPEEDPPFEIAAEASSETGGYQPLWGSDQDQGEPVSPLGWSLLRMSRAEVLAAADRLGPESRGVLLEGRTEAPGSRRTSDGTLVRGGSGLRGTYFCPVNSADAAAAAAAFTAAAAASKSSPSRRGCCPLASFVPSSPSTPLPPSIHICPTQPPQICFPCTIICWRRAARRVAGAQVGGVPLFSTDDVAPCSGSDGWLSFTRRAQHAQQFVQYMLARLHHA